LPKLDAEQSTGGGGGGDRPLRPPPMDPHLVYGTLICTELKGHWFVCFSFWLFVLD